MVFSLRKALERSAIIHGIILFVLLISPYLPFSSWRPASKVTWVELPKGAGETFGTGVKKSKDLPKTTIQEQKKKPAKKETKKVKGDAAVVKKPEGLKKEKTEEELRMEKVLARAEKEVSSRKEAVPEAAQIPDTAEGGFEAGTGGPGTTMPENPELYLYQLKIRERVITEWIPPLQYQEAGNGLICKIVVYINEQGRVTQASLEEKSGSEAYDLSALRAIEKSSPFEPPPANIRQEVLRSGFLFEFRPEDKKDL